METIQGKLDHIRFEGDNNWTIAGLLANDKNITIVGSLVGAKIGDSLELAGEWQDHPSFGQQFKFHSCTVIEPVTDEGVIGFLESRLANVGRARAELMLQHFSADRIFDVILKEHHRLTAIPGINAERAEKIHLEYTESKKLRDTIVFLKQFRLTDNQVSKVIETYKNKTIEVVKKNPYQLIKDVSGFGFKTVDEFALRMGIDRHGIDRAVAGCLHVMQVAQGEGNTYLPSDLFRTTVRELLRVTFELVDKATEALSQDRLIVLEGDRVYNAHLRGLEFDVANRLIEMTRD